MKKKILGGIIVGASIFSLMGCDSSATKSDRYIEYEYMQMEDKIGLEKMNDDNFSKVLDSSVYGTSEYKEYRASKIKGDLITEEIINEVVSRAKLLLDRYYKSPSNYILMDKIIKSDSLGYHIQKDLALNLLKESIEFGSVNEITNKVRNDDDSIYWYAYVGGLLKDYYGTTSDFLNEEKKIILEYLKEMKAYPILVAGSNEEKSDLVNSVIEDKGNRLAELRVKVKSLLQKKYFQDMN